MTTDWRVGRASLSILEQELRTYILAHVVDKKFIGDVQYLIAYDAIQKYRGRQDGNPNYAREDFPQRHGLPVQKP